MTIDYKQPTKYNRNVSEMLEFLLWTTCTAGKSSEIITPRFNALMQDCPAPDVIRSHGNRIRGLLRKHGIGQYDRLSNAGKLSASANSTVLVSDLVISFAMHHAKTSQLSPASDSKLHPSSSYPIDRG